MILEILRHHKVTTPEPQQTSHPTMPVTSSVAAAETEAISKTTQSREKTDDTASKKETHS